MSERLSDTRAIPLETTNDSKISQGGPRCASLRMTAVRDKATLCTSPRFGLRCLSHARLYAESCGRRSPQSAIGGDGVKFCLIEPPEINVAVEIIRRGRFRDAKNIPDRHPVRAQMPVTNPQELLT